MAFEDESGLVPRPLYRWPLYQYEAGRRQQRCGVAQETALFHVLLFQSLTLGISVITWLLCTRSMYIPCCKFFGLILQDAMVSRPGMIDSYHQPIVEGKRAEYYLSL